MSTGVLQPRHDPADLRRLAELDCLPVQWRRPPLPARSRRRDLVLISDDPRPHGLLADLLRGLTLAGHVALIRPTPATDASSTALNLHFGLPTAAATTGATPSPSSALVLPSLAELRGNAAAKRAAWQALRAALR